MTSPAMEFWLCRRFRSEAVMGIFVGLAALALGVVVMQRGTAARDLLVGLGYAVEWHEYPMEHSVCIEEVRALESFLHKVLTA